MRHADRGTQPPCESCPKLAGRPDKRPLPDADDPCGSGTGWVWDVVRWRREAEAVGDFGRPDPLLRQLAVAAKEYDDRVARQEAAADLAGAVADGVRKALNRR